mmetsp:Transcript_27176/g.45530  ORF Transcript_27176/g.45530 Transcript_27176/m.45530 type:complete len:264 (-) Transcript_27176:2359-3150(-)
MVFARLVYIPQLRLHLGNLVLHGLSLRTGRVLGRLDLLVRLLQLFVLALQLLQQSLLAIPRTTHLLLVTVRHLVLRLLGISIRLLQLGNLLLQPRNLFLLGRSLLGLVGCLVLAGSQLQAQRGDQRDVHVQRGLKVRRLLRLGVQQLFVRRNAVLQLFRVGEELARLTVLARQLPLHRFILLLQSVDLVRLCCLLVTQLVLLLRHVVLRRLQCSPQLCASLLQRGVLCGLCLHRSLGRWVVDLVFHGLHGLLLGRLLFFQQLL